jgi:uncharacterized membrane protein
MDGHNPYAPPTAQVGGSQSQSGSYDTATFNAEGRSVPAGQGWNWFKSGWQLFKQQPLMFWVALIIAFVVFVVISIIPIVNLITTIALPVLVAGFGSCARSVQRTGTFELGQIFDGFRNRLGTQLLAGLLYFLALIVVLGLLFVVFGASGLFGMMTGGLAGGENAAAVLGSMGAVFFLVYMVVMIGLGSLITFTPYIIHETQLTAPQAMLASMKGCLKNIPAFLVGVLVAIGLMIVSIIPAGLGLLVLIPVAYLAVFLAYDEIYYE